MSFSSDLTKQRIVDCARDFFLEKGYKDTNVREIAAAANVTTGALYKHFGNKNDLFSYIVKDVYHEAKGLLSTKKNTFTSENIKSIVDGFSIENSLNELNSFVCYIYKNYDVIELLLKHAAGSTYGNFIEELIAAYTSRTKLFLQAARKARLTKTQLDEQEIRIVTTGYILSIAAIVLDKIPQCKVEKYTKTIVIMYTYGLYGLLGWEPR